MEYLLAILVVYIFHGILFSIWFHYTFKYDPKFNRVPWAFIVTLWLEWRGR